MEQTILKNIENVLLEDFTDDNYNAVNSTTSSSQHHINAEDIYIKRCKEIIEFLSQIQTTHVLNIESDIMLYLSNIDHEKISPFKALLTRHFENIRNLNSLKLKHDGLFSDQVFISKLEHKVLEGEIKLNEVVNAIEEVNVELKRLRSKIDDLSKCAMNYEEQLTGIQSTVNSDKKMLVCAQKRFHESTEFKKKLEEATTEFNITWQNIRNWGYSNGY